VYASNAAACLALLGRRREACVACLTALRCEPGFARPRARLAQLCASAEGLEEALAEAQAAAAAAPGSAALAAVLEQLTGAARARAESGALFNRRRFADAERVATAALEAAELVQPVGVSAPVVGAAMLLADRSRSRAAQERFRDALRDIEAALAHDPASESLGEQRVVVVRALNRAVAFQKEGLDGRTEAATERGAHSTQLL